MLTWIALLRGINVGGKNLLPMKELVAIFEEAGCNHVETYIQSGNVVFRSKERDAATLARTISREVKSRHGFQPQVMLLTLNDIEKAVAGNPFPEAADEPKSLHLFFLANKADDPDLDGLEKLRAESERFELTKNVFYLHAPNGIGRSRLAANAERLIGVPVTARNWRSIQKIVDMAREIQ
ncbi:MAG: DUF1697 domain-containing protein [Planctomycetes bacterium]|nr:DUF1697 domain-containing protein [Planctomycetota bacterium]